MSDLEARLEHALADARQAVAANNLPGALDLLETALALEARWFAALPAATQAAHGGLAAWQGAHSKALRLKTAIEAHLQTGSTETDTAQADAAIPNPDPDTTAATPAPPPGLPTTNPSLESLLPQLSDPDPDQRIRGIFALIKEKDPAALSILHDLIDLDPSVKVRYFAKKSLDSLRAVLNIQGQDPAIPPEKITGADPQAVTRLLSSPNVGDRRAAMLICRDLELSAHVPDLLQALRNEPDPVLRADGVQILGRLGDELIVPELARFLDDPNFRVRANTIEALGQIGHFSIYPFIIRKLQDETEDNRIRANAAKVLKDTGRERVMEILERMIRSNEPWYQDSALYVFKFLPWSDKVAELLQIALTSTETSVRDRAAALLEKHQGADPGAGRPSGSAGADPAGTAAAIEAGLASDEPKVRLAAVQQAESEMSSGLDQVLMRHLARETDARVKATIILALGKVGGPQVIPAVQPHLTDADARVRANAVQTLGMVGGRAAWPLIYGMLHDANNRVKANAIIALKDDPYFQIVRPLEDMIASPDPMMRRSAHFCISVIGRDDCIPLLDRLLSDADVVLKNRALDTLMFLKQTDNAHARAVLARHGIFDLPTADESPAAGVGTAAEPVPARFRSPADLTLSGLRALSREHLDHVGQWDLEVVYQPATFCPRPAVDTQLQRFLAGQATAFQLLGTSGIGKTCHLFHFARRICEHGDVVCFVPGESLQAGSLA